MLRVLINQATEGMRLAMPVVHPRSGNVLLRSGFVLNERMVRKLRELEVHEFWIDYPGTEEIRRFVSPTILSQQAKLTMLLAGEFERVQNEGAAASARLDYAPYRCIMRDLIEMLLCDPQAAAYIVEMAGGAANLLRHSSEVSLLSIALGLKLQDYLIAQRPRLNAGDARNVSGLGVGALMHDVGYLRIGEDAVKRSRRCGMLGGDAAWREHVTVGHRLLSGTVPASAVGVILQHHQHFDGTGFPHNAAVEHLPVGSRKAITPDPRCAEGVASRGLMGEEIHVFARIACVANHFDRLRRPAVHTASGRAQPRVRVLRQMFSKPLRSRFDPVVLDALPAAAPAYQPGSLVRLSNGEHAVVLDWSAEQPCRPSVQVIEVENSGDDQSPDPALSAASVRPSKRSSTSLPRYDLSECRELSIAWHEGFDVSRDNFEFRERKRDEAGAASARRAA